MKKFVVTVLSLVLILAALCACSAPDIFNTNTEVRYKIYEDHAVVSELPNATGVTEVVIPDEYEGVPVTEVADFAGCNLEGVKKITVGKNVESIGVWAFTNNQKLEAFEVSEDNGHFCAVDGVLFSKDMKTVVFYPPAGKTEFSIPDTVETIRSKSFYKCQKLEKLVLPKCLKKIEEKAFFRCSNLNDIVLPQGIESIEKDAFGYCSKLSKIVIPSSIKSIGEYAFYNCTALLDVTVEAKKADVELGKEWQPTNNGLSISELKVVFK